MVNIILLGLPLPLLFGSRELEWGASTCLAHVGSATLWLCDFRKVLWELRAPSVKQVTRTGYSVSSPPGFTFYHSNPWEARHYPPPPSPLPPGTLISSCIWLSPKLTGFALCFSSADAIHSFDCCVMFNYVGTPRGWVNTYSGCFQILPLGRVLL